jgi:hypothetical protein
MTILDYVTIETGVLYSRDRDLRIFFFEFLAHIHAKFQRFTWGF